MSKIFVNRETVIATSIKVIYKNRERGSEASEDWRNLGDQCSSWVGT